MSSRLCAQCSCFPFIFTVRNVHFVLSKVSRGFFLLLLKVLTNVSTHLGGVVSQEVYCKGAESIA